MLFGDQEMTPMQVALASISTTVHIQWSIKYLYFTPVLLRYGMSKAAAAWLWSAGPILAMVSSPFLGRSSDRCE